MPRYLQVTPTFQPISLQDRLKPMEAYVDTYNKLNDDIAKTEGLMDIIPSMLDDSNPQDKAVIDSFAKYREGFNQIADDINNGNLNAMMQHARELRSTYAKDYAKIPIAYEAKQNAIKNTKLPQNWIGDRPEYHGTTDFIGKTPTYFGMDADDVYKTGKDMLQGISKQVYDDTGWNLPPELYSQYFEKIRQQGVNAQMMNTFMDQVKRGIIANGGSEEDASKVSSVAVRAMNDALENITNKYQANRLTSDEDKMKFLGAALAGFQAGAAYDTEDKTLGTHVGGSSGGSGGRYSSTVVQPPVSPTGPTGALTSGSNYDRGNKEAVANRERAYSYSPLVLNGKLYYLDATTLNEYNNNKSNTDKEVAYIEQNPSSPEALSLVNTYLSDLRQNPKSSTITFAQALQLPMEDKVNLAVQWKKRQPEVELQSKYEKSFIADLNKYKYLQINDPLAAVRLGADIDLARSNEHQVNIGRAEDSGTYVERVGQTIADLMLGKLEEQGKSGSKETVTILQNGEERTIKPGKREELMKALREDPKAFSLMGNSRYGIILQHGADRYVFRGVTEFDNVRHLADALRQVYNFTANAKGITKQGKTDQGTVKKIIDIVNNHGDINKFDIVKDTKTYIGNGLSVVTLNDGNNLLRILLTNDGKAAEIKGQPLYSYATDANKYNMIADLIGDYIGNAPLEDIYKGVFNTKK